MRSVKSLINLLTHSLINRTVSFNPYISLIYAINTEIVYSLFTCTVADSTTTTTRFAIPQTDRASEFVSQKFWSVTQYDNKLVYGFIVIYRMQIFFINSLHESSKK